MPSIFAFPPGGGACAILRFPVVYACALHTVLMKLIIRGIYSVLFTASLFFCVFLFCTCGSSVQVDTAFYYWQQRLSLSPAEIDYLKETHTSALYIKFFDVDWDRAAGQAVPLAKLSCQTGPPAGIAIIPCVFITNRVMENTPERDIPQLAGKILTLLHSLQNRTGLKDSQELQIDCDWSVGTKQAYFALLRRLKTLAPQTLLSVTVRLHQLKFPETTGVPPADKAVLMFYNMGDLSDINTGDSIMDLERASDYLDGLPAYPLHTDIALPVFSWAVLLRFDKVTKLIHNITAEMLERTPQIEHTTGNLYRVKKSFYFHGDYLYKDDILRYEDVPMPVLRRAAELLAAKVRRRDRSIIFFHLNRRLPKEYSCEALETIVHLFD